MAAPLLALHDIFNSDDEALASKLFIAYKKMGAGRVESIINQVRQMIKEDKPPLTSEEKEKLFFELAGAWKDSDIFFEDIKKSRHFKEENLKFD